MTRQVDGGYAGTNRTSKYGLKPKGDYDKVSLSTERTINLGVQIWTEAERRL